MKSSTNYLLVVELSDEAVGSKLVKTAPSLIVEFDLFNFFLDLISYG